MTVRQRIHTRPRNTKGTWSDYEREKRLWDAENPNATYQQRDQAMRAIARRLGL